MKRCLAFALVFITLFSICACSTTISTETPSPQVTVQVTATPAPLTGNQEIDRAIALGIVPNELQTDLDMEITFEQFCLMTDNMMLLCDKNYSAQWLTTAKLAFKSNDIMLRQDGMLALLYAAEIMGIADYNIDPSAQEQAANHDAMWNEMKWDYPMFPNWQEKMNIGWDKDLDHMTAAVMFAMRRTSKWTNSTVFEWDEQTSMRVADKLTRKEAILAIVRLYDSQISDSECDVLLATTISDYDKEATQKIRADMEGLRNAIIDSKTDVSFSGKAYYVSNSGSDENDGLSKETPWATVNKVNNKKLESGDAVFFERGSLWRGTQLKAQQGVTYSAYGEGEKPRLYISPENGSGAEKWSLLDGANNIWVYYKNMEDCGNIVFNDGEACGIKELPFYTGDKFVLRYDHNTTFDVIKELDQDLEFFTPADSNLPSTLPYYQYLGEYTEGKVYLRCDKGNPGEVFKSIEFMTPTYCVELSDNCVIDNLCFKYTGTSGTTSQIKGVTVQNCEFGWIGGQVHCYNPENEAEGGVVQSGDAVMPSGQDNSCIGNYIHDVYDYGVIIEAGYQSGFRFDNMENITVKGNLMERCGGSVSIFSWEEPPNPEHLFININVENNYAMYNGYGLFDRGNNRSAGIEFMTYPNLNEGIYIRNNVFYLSKAGPLVSCMMSEEYSPILSGNTYVQKPQGKLVVWYTTGDEGYAANDENIEEIIHNVIGDKEGIILKSID